MIEIKEAIIVEGRYDKIRLSSVVRGTIVETHGFRIFRDREAKEYLKRLAEECGVVILTDSDRAGFLIRNHLKSFLPEDRIKQAYIPEIRGVEKRKRHPSAEGLLGVEGVSEQELTAALERAGCNVGVSRNLGLTAADLYADGLSGRSGSAEDRRELCRRLRLPARLSGKEFLSALNRLLTAEQYCELVFEITGEKSRFCAKTEEQTR